MHSILAIEYEPEAMTRGLQTTVESKGLVDVAQDFATNILPACLLVIQDTRRGGL